jgi:hypothetical protein
MATFFVLLSLWLVADPIARGGAPALAFLLVGTIVVLLTLLEPEFGVFILAFGMLLSPEIKVPWIQLPARDVVIRIDDAMILLIGFAWFARSAVAARGLPFLKTPLNRPILLFAFLCCLSTARGALTGAVVPVTGFFYVLKFIEFFLLYFLVVNTVREPAQVRRVMQAFFFTVIAVCLYAIYDTLVTGRAGRATTPFETEEEPATLGGYLLFAFALAFCLALYTRSFIARVGYVGIILLAIPPFLYSLSRGSYFAFPFMFLAVLWMSRKKAVPVLLLVAAVIFGPHVMPEAAIERVEYTFEERIERYISPWGHALALDPSSIARLERWEGVVRQWMYRPLLGQGVTGVGFVDSQVVRVLGELGIAGLFLLGLMFKTHMHETARLYRAFDDPYIKGLCLGLFCGTIGLLFHAVTANTFVVVRIAGPFWLVTGLVMSLRRHMPEAPAAVAAPPTLRPAWAR